MKSLNKSLLTAAVVGALALPGLVSAANLNWNSLSVQTTYATDLIVDNGSSLTLPQALEIVGDGLDAANLNSTTIPAQQETVLDIVLSLTGAEFGTANPVEVAQSVVYGNQFGLVNQTLPASAIANATYSGGEGGRRVLRYLVTLPNTTTGGNVDPGYAIRIPPTKIAHVKNTLGNPGGTVALSVTINRQSGSSQILAANSIIARSAPGLRVSSIASPHTNKVIDVAPGGGASHRTYFSPNGAVGNSNPSVPAGEDILFNAGGFTLDINEAPRTDGTPGYVNDIDGSVADAAYNIVGSGRIHITVDGTDLSPWQGANRVWVERSGNNCARAGGAFQDLIVTAGNPTQAVTAAGGISPLHALFGGPNAGVGLTPPGPSAVDICFRATGNMPAPANVVPMVAQALSGTVEVQYNLPGSRVEPGPFAFDLATLRENGSTVYLQNFNPGGNGRAQSILRVTNHNARACQVRIDAKDDAGRLSGTVRATIAAHASEQFNSDVLESGDDPRLTGNFRKGTGKWYVRVTAECAQVVVSGLNRNRDTGVLTNLTSQSDDHGTWSTPITSVDP